MKVRLFSLPGSVCHRCRLTKMKLAKEGIAYDEVRLEADPEGLAYVKSLGYESAPVVEVEFGDGAAWHWDGYRPDHILRLSEAYA